LFLLADDNVTGVVSNVHAGDFGGLVLVDVLESKQTLLAHQTHLFVSPYFRTIISFFLNFLTKLFNGALKIICVILSFLGTFKEKLTLFIEFGLHFFLNVDLVG
jgi:hypothetical protein